MYHLTICFSFLLLASSVILSVFEWNVPQKQPQNERFPWILKVKCCLLWLPRKIFFKFRGLHDSVRALNALCVTLIVRLWDPFSLQIQRDSIGFWHTIFIFTTLLFDFLFLWNPFWFLLFSSIHLLGSLLKQTQQCSFTVVPVTSENFTMRRCYCCELLHSSSKSKIEKISSFVLCSTDWLCKLCLVIQRVS